MLNIQLLCKFSPVFLSALAIIVWAVFPKDPGIFPLDDAYIHLNYVENLANTGRLSFNTGEISTGTSSPIWVVILAVFLKLGSNAYWTATILSLLSMIILVNLTFIATRKVASDLQLPQTTSFWMSLLASCLLISNGNLIWLTLSGMETILFLAIGLLGVLSYIKWGLGYRTGLIIALLTLTHPSGISLFITLVLVTLITRHGWQWIKGLISYFAILSPYLLFSAYVNGNIIPTTGKAKTLTYVDSGLNIERAWEFTQGFIQYQNYLPQHFVLASALFILIILYLSNSRFIRLKTICSQFRTTNISRHQISNHSINMLRFVGLKRRFFTDNLLTTCLITWGIIHFGMYAMSFRILLHHTRYLSIEYVLWAILGATIIGLIQQRKPKMFIGLGISIISLGLASWSITDWGQLYINNTQHVKQAYIPMADWIKANTSPDSKIASFDIGIIGWYGDRHVIDLGGVTSSDTHECLKARNCGEFLRESNADYIVYPRNPDVDIYNSIYLSEYQGPMLLKQKPLVYFSSNQYKAPTLTHSQRLDLYQIDGWFPKTTEGIQNTFAYDKTEFQPLWVDIDDHLEFVGYWIDYRLIEKIPRHPLFVNFSYFFKATKPFDDPYWVHMIFTDPTREKIYFYEKHIPTHNLLKPSDWPIGQVIKDHHIRIMPESLPQSRFRILTTVTLEPNLEWENPEKYTWIELGEFENRKNTIEPVSW